MLRRSHLPERLVLVAGAAAEAKAPAPAAAAPKQTRKPTDDDEEFAALIAALRTHGGSVAKAAAAINVSRARVYRILSAHPDFSWETVRH